MTLLSRTLATIAASFVLTVGATSLHAEGLSLPKIEHAATLKECSSCHMAYPPQMLPQRSWDALMGDLTNHFGDNAQIDEAVRVDILAYLLANSADAPDSKRYLGLLRGIKPEVVPTRITEMPWWRGAHGEVNLARIKTTKVKSAANCVGCHAGADKGYFAEE